MKRCVCPQCGRDQAVLDGGIILCADCRSCIEAPESQVEEFPVADEVATPVQPTPQLPRAITGPRSQSRRTGQANTQINQSLQSVRVMVAVTMVVVIIMYIHVVSLEIRYQVNSYRAEKLLEKYEQGMEGSFNELRNFTAP